MSKSFSILKQEFVTKLKIKENIISQSAKEFDSRPDFAQISVSFSRFIVEKNLHGTSLSVREDVCSHIDPR